MYTRGHFLMFASGIAIGACIAFITFVMLPDNSAPPPWMPDRSRDFLVSKWVMPTAARTRSGRSGGRLLGSGPQSKARSPLATICHNANGVHEE